MFCVAHPFYMFDKKVTDVAGNGPTGNVTAVGDVITYQINVTNTGNIELTNITLNDSLINLTGPAGDNAPAGVLNVGEDMDLHWELHSNSTRHKH